MNHLEMTPPELVEESFCLCFCYHSVHCLKAVPTCFACMQARRVLVTPEYIILSN